MIGLYIKGYAIKQVTTPILKILQPNASKPPSAKKRHWMSKTEASVMNAGNGPSKAASRRPPPI
jgi:hypothetical protein